MRVRWQARHDFDRQHCNKIMLPCTVGVGDGPRLCKNAVTRNGDRMKILRNRIRVRKDSPAHSVSLDWRKAILVASQFFAFSHSLGHQRPNYDVGVMSASPPEATKSRRRTK